MTLFGQAALDHSDRKGVDYSRNPKPHEHDDGKRQRCTEQSEKDSTHPSDRLMTGPNVVASRYHGARAELAYCLEYPDEA